MLSKRPGVCVLDSLEDPRWNKELECEHRSITATPKEVFQVLGEMKVLYGEPPEDLTMSCTKY